MGTIELRTGSPDRARALLHHAIERERGLIADGIARTHQRVEALAAKTGVDTAALTAGRVPHPADQDMNLLELEGEVEMLAALEEELKILDELEICP